MILQLEHIYKDYLQGKMTVPVLKDVSLSVDAGEYLAIMGPSGSGKTTLMNIIGCLDRPTSGSYHLNGHDVLGYRENELSDVRLKHIGFVFQSFHLLPKQTALDNVALPLIYAGVSKKERRERAAQALERVGLGDRIGFKPNQLSGGQQQRVAIARAIVNHPSILLADEPTGALDSQSGVQVMELFQSLNDEGMTVIMITHDGEIASYARRKAIIRDGVLSDDEARAMAEVKLVPPQEGEEKIVSVALSTLSEHFPDGVHVNLSSLKRKKLVAEDATGFRVVGKNTLERSLVITANAFNLSALKMILLTGGRAIVLKERDPAADEAAQTT